MRSAARNVFLLVVAAFAGGTSCAPEVATIIVSPPEVFMNATGETVQLVAEPRDRRGAVMPANVLTFRSRDPQVATVSSGGLITAVGHGGTTIEITAAGSRAMEFVRIVVRLPDRLVVRPASTSCYIGGVKRLEAEILDRDGNVIKNAPIQWSSSDPAKAVVEGGEVTGVDEGEVTVTATGLGLTASSHIAVSWAPEQRAVMEMEKGARTHRGGGGGGQKTDQGGGWDPRLRMFDD